jgi:hypothetical protein
VGEVIVENGSFSWDSQRSFDHERKAKQKKLFTKPHNTKQTNSPNNDQRSEGERIANERAFADAETDLRRRPDGPDPPTLREINAPVISNFFQVHLSVLLVSNRETCGSHWESRVRQIKLIVRNNWRNDHIKWSCEEERTIEPHCPASNLEI